MRSCTLYDWQAHIHKGKLMTLSIRPMQWANLPELHETLALDDTDLDCLQEIRDILARRGKLALRRASGAPAFRPRPGRNPDRKSGPGRADAARYRRTPFR